MSLDNLAAWARFFDSASGGSWLLALALVALTMAVAGVWAAALRLSRLPSRQRPAPPADRADDERDIHPPTRLERILREDAASRPLTRSQIRDQFGVDVHDVFPEEEER